MERNNIAIVISPIKGIDCFRDDWLFIVSTMDDDVIIGNNANVLLLNYMDVDARGAFSFSEEHANRVVKFLIDRSGTYNTIACLCDQGVSRSSGLAAALMEAYGQDSSSIWADNYYRPNKHVYFVMKKAIQKRSSLSLETRRIHEEIQYDNGL